jgi:peptide deformylase
MILPIVKRPNPILKQQAQLVEPTEITNLQPLINDMFETLAASGGVGLAAPQVGHSLSLFVVKLEGQEHVFVNPVVISASSETDVYPEGCLSLPGIVLNLRRSKQIKVMFRDRNGNQQVQDMGEGWSRVFLHEFDHLQGIMIDDRVGRVQLDMAKRKIAKKQKNQQRQRATA